MTNLTAFNGGATLSSPNRIVMEYFDSVRRLVKETKDANTPNLCRQNAALAVIMAVTAVEVFLNLWFKLKAEEANLAGKKSLFSEDLEKRITLEKKLDRWPMRYLNKTLNFSAGAGAEFNKLKTLRNSIVHFTSTHSSFEYESIAIHGLANTTEYDNLSFDKARWSLFTAEDVLAELFALSGTTRENIPSLLQLWTGRAPLPLA